MINNSNIFDLEQQPVSGLNFERCRDDGKFSKFDRECTVGSLGCVAGGG